MEDKEFLKVVIVTFIAAIFIIWILVRWNNRPHEGIKMVNMPLPPSMATLDRLLFKQLIDMVDKSRQSRDKPSEIVAWQNISNIAQENIKKIKQE